MPGRARPPPSSLKEWLSPPSPCIKGGSVSKTWADSPRTHSSTPGCGVRREGDGLGCSCREPWRPPVPTPCPTGSAAPAPAFGGVLSLQRCVCRKPTHVPAEQASGMPLPPWQPGNGGVRERPLSPNRADSGNVPDELWALRKHRGSQSTLVSQHRALPLAGH